MESEVVLSESGTGKGVVVERALLLEEGKSA